MNPQIFARLSLVAAVLLAGCTPQTRSVGSIIGAGPATGGGTATAQPQLNGVEREIRDGVLLIGPGAPSGALRRRVAVVIGNSAYSHVSKLGNPTNDAHAIARLLKKHGFEVIEGYDLGKRAFERLLRKAVLAGGPGAEIVAFYAGHGFQIASRNYLVPVDARLTGANDLPFQTVRLKTLLRILDDRSDKHLTFIDACRNNPFPGQSAKPGATRGVAPTSIGFSAPWVPQGGFVGYATSPGALAYDGDGANSPFTTALLRRVDARPNDAVASILRRVRSDVRAATGGEQVPTWTSRLGGAFAFHTPAGRVAAISAAAAGNPAAPPTVTAAATPIRPAASPGASPVPNIRPQITVDAPLEKVVAVGGRIAAELDLPKTATVTVIRPPANGTVATIGASATLRPSPPGPVAGKNLGALVYIMAPEQKPAGGSIADNVVTEQLVAEVKIPGKPPERVAVNLRLTPSNCDFQAADFLDVQGVAIYRADKQLSATRSLSACAAAVRQDPRNGRFHYQYGKALEAKGDYQAAVNAYRRAARLGHIRANHAIGQLALRVQGAGPISMNYFQIGAAKGDPLAIQALGKLLLETAIRPNEFEEAFDMLSFAVDLGLPEAMRTLAGYFGNPASPGYDPDRAKVFAREAGLREATLLTRPRPATPITEPIDFDGPDGGDDSGDTGKE